MLDNLLTNAIKFTPSSGTIELNASLDNGDAKISVSDTGAGIHADLLPHLFEPFRQGSDHCRQGGLGLGLAIVKQIVEAHGGVVSAESAGRGKGSTFVVRLSLEDDADEITIVQSPVSRNSSGLPVTSDHPVEDRHKRSSLSTVEFIAGQAISDL